ncbi:MAG: LuxR C-terminal-related transcriptional regulator [Flexilinea sp.]
MPKSNKLIVIDGTLLSEVSPIQAGSASWFEWLSSANNFTYKDGNGRFIAQCEIRRNKTYWYAYRRRSGKLVKAYLGKSEDLTKERLQHTSLSLAGNSLENQLIIKSMGNELHKVETRIDSTFLSLTKIYPPVLPRQIISRTRLNQQINSPLTLIIAPSGFGKTTLLNDWKQTCGYPVVWLTLDAHDNYPSRFWNSVVSAFQILDTEFGTDLLKYIGTTVAIKPAETILHLTNEIGQSQTMFPRLGMVLDDFHLINHSEIYEAMQIWLEHLPAKFQLIISGNTKPPLSFGHLRAQGLLTELEVNDLRFTESEGVNFLKKYPQDPPLAYDDLEKLVKHTEGWATGLTLTVIALGKQADRRQFIETFSGAHIYMREYFMETVLQHCTPEIQSFLLKTAILKSLNGSLCNAITGRSDGDAMLAHLWQENLFITRLEEQGWYRYHDLFAETLFSQLSIRFPKEVPLLHQRAAHWYREQYAFGDAIYHLLSIEAWEEAATLIEEMALRELEQFGEDSSLLRWLQELPESVVQKHKNLLFVYMRLANLALPQKKIEQFISYIEKSISSKPLEQQSLDEHDVLTEIKQIRIIWAQGHAFIPPTLSGNVNDDRWDLFNQLYLLRPAYRQYQNFPEAPIIELLRKAQVNHNLYITLMAGGVLAKRYLFTGQLRRSEKICRQILEDSFNQRGKLPQTSSIALEVLSLIYFERNDLDLAQRYLAQAGEVDPNPFSTNMPIHFLIMRAKIQIALNQGLESLATIKAAQDLNMRRPGGLLTSEDLLAYEALISVRIGEIILAEQLLMESNEIDNHHLLRQVQAEIYLKKECFHDAEEILAETLAKSSELVVIEPLMETRVFLALSLFGQHRINQALQVIVDAVRLAAPERFIRPFLIGGQACASLLSLALLSQNLSDDMQIFIKELLQLMKSTDESPQVSKAELELLSTSASITPREQEILLLLNTGYSNREIAAKLSISESTVKTHLGTIYFKLGVNSRGQATNRARQLRLVQ